MNPHEIIIAMIKEQKICKYWKRQAPRSDPMKIESVVFFRLSLSLYLRSRSSMHLQQRKRSEAPYDIHVIQSKHQFNETIFFYLQFHYAHFVDWISSQHESSRLHFFARKSFTKYFIFPCRHFFRPPSTERIFSRSLSLSFFFDQKMLIK